VENTAIVKQFIALINRHNAEGLSALMTDGHLFIDAHGNGLKGNSVVTEAWVTYFQLFPDYEIDISEIFSNGELVAVFGFASGTYKHLKTESNEYYWRLPISLKVIVKGNKIKLWQVYA
jgi:ketosteroid isomerase-like protein